jgi:hypothetical protein
MAIESVAVAKMRKSPSDCQVRALTRCPESTAAIVASKSVVAGVPQWLRACRDRASAHSGCRAVRPIPAHHHAFDNAFFQSPPETCRACPTAFWPHGAGSTASDLYDAGVTAPESASDQAPDPAGASTLPAWAKALCAVLASPIMPSERRRELSRLRSWRDDTPPLLFRRSPVRSLGQASIPPV